MTVLWKWSCEYALFSILDRKRNFEVDFGRMKVELLMLSFTFNKYFNCRVLFKVSENLT